MKQLSSDVNNMEIVGINFQNGSKRKRKTLRGNIIAMGKKIE